MDGQDEQDAKREKLITTQGQECKAPMELELKYCLVI